LAAHCEKKLLKSQINDCKIVKTVEQIAQPHAAMALRLSGHLLLGVSRVYFKKVEYLYTDCSEALVKIKMAFRPGDVNMEQSVVNANAITLPETFPDFELLLPGDLANDLLPEAEEGLFTLHVAQARDITISSAEGARGGSSGSSISLPEQHGDGPDVPKPYDEDKILDDDQPTYIRNDGDDQGGVPDWTGGGSDWDYQGRELSPDEIPIRTDPEEGEAGDKSGDTSLPAFGAPRPPKQAKLKHFAVDKRTQLTVRDMENYINDPSSLLRKGERAPPTRVLMERKRQEMEDDTLSKIFRSPTMKKMPQSSRDAFAMSLKTKSELVKEFPGSEMDGTEGPRDGRKGDEDDVPERENADPDRGWPDPDQGWGDPYVPVGDGGAPDELRDRTADLAADDPEGGFYPEMPTEEGPEMSSQSRTRIGTTGGETSFVITQRTAKMHKFLGAKFETQDPLSFETLFAGKSKRTVAIGFFEILNIKSKNCIDLHQSKAYADITLKKHPENFDKLSIS